VSSLLVHPELLGIEAEDLAALVLDDPDAQSLRSLLLDAHAEAGQPEVEVLESRLKRAGLQAAAERLSSHVRPGDRWILDPHADPMRLEDALRQAVILHCRSGALNSELRQAERALVDDPTEATFAWLCDVKERLAVVAGAEAEADPPGGAETPTA
jgi:DNA primase